MAAEIAETFPALRVVLLSRDEPGLMMGAAARAYLYRALDRLGIEVRAGVDVTKVLPGAVEIDGDLAPLAADAVVWTTGFRAPALAAEAGSRWTAMAGSSSTRRCGPRRTLRST
jgi:NADH dehydrogenase FAD-containing subunit